MHTLSQSVWAAASDNVWIAGGVDLAHWDGHSWTQDASPERTQLNGIWGSSPADVWLTGNDGAILRMVSGAVVDAGPHVDLATLDACSPGGGTGDAGADDVADDAIVADASADATTADATMIDVSRPNDAMGASAGDTGSCSCRSGRRERGGTPRAFALAMATCLGLARSRWRSRSRKIPETS
jgi:hypothetical protein